MKLTRVIFGCFLLLTLVGCEYDRDQVEYEDVTLTLIGDELVRIEEGTEYEDLGVLVDGEEVDFLGYYSNINNEKVGTYYVKYEYMGKEVLRTVEVIPGAKTTLLGIIDEFAQADNFAYTLDLDVRFSRGGQDFHTFIYQDYDVTGDYKHGTENRTSYTMNEYTQTAYIYTDKANKVEDHYLYDEHSFWYQDYSYYPKPTTNVTDFSLEGIRSVTKETVGEQDVYTGYLNYEDYMVAYNTKINLIPDEHFDFESDDYITIEITVEDSKIVKIETDLLDIMVNNISEASDATPKEYFYTYTFDNYDEVEQIVIPEEGVQAKRLVYPDYTGTGTETDPFIIMDKTQLLSLHDNLDKHFKLGADIDLSGNSWTPIGYFNTLYGQPHCFTGSLDGNGYAINNMSVHGQRFDEEYGFFLCVEGEVKDVTFNNVDIYLGEENISFTGGILSAELNNATVTDITLNGSMTIRVNVTEGFSEIVLGSLAGEIKNGGTYGGNTYNVTLKLITNLPDTNYTIHEVTGKGSEFLSTYTSTSTVTVEVID